MKIIVGWQNDLVASAALLVGGRLVGAVEEERFTRVKQQEGFPRQTVQWLLRRAGLTVGDVDEWAYGWFAGTNSAELLPSLARRVAQGQDECAVAVMAQRLATEHTKDLAIRERGYREAREFGIPPERMTEFEHHPSHAWSAHAFSPFERSLVVTFDGRGDRKSSTVSVAGPGGLREKEWRSSIDSLGHVYSQVTHVLGYRTNRHEGKVTGLAGRGDGAAAKEFLRTLVDFQDGVISTRPGSDFTPTDREVPPHTREAMLKFSAEDLAAGVQDLTEELVCRYISDSVGRYSLHDVALAGGLFANVQLNRRIRDLACVRGVFVQPNMGDAGLALGAAAAAWFAHSGQAKIPVWDMFLGPDPQPSSRPATRRVASGTADWVAQAVAAGRVVGLVRGACEFGPRALGHRSILADASQASINDDLNQRLSRTEFMPFAPILRGEDAAASLVGWRPDDQCAPYMTMAYECTPEFAARHPAVVHVDGTARPQVVTPESDPYLHEIITRYYERTGRWAMINTSFNRHEEPIVLTVDDGLGALDGGAVDAVADEYDIWEA